MGTSVGEIGLDLVVNQNQFNQQMNSIGKIAKKAGALLASAFAVKQLINFGKECTNLGSDLAEVQNIVDVVFTNMSEDVNKFANDAMETLGMSETMAKQYTGTFGAMAKAFGFTESQTYDMSTALTSLTGDVASFYNLDHDMAYTKLKSVFSGETETLKDLGIVMTQTALDSYALSNGIGKTTKQMSEQEKVMLRYNFVQDQLQSATGDFVRTQDGWANQTRVLQLRWDSLKATLGQGFINLFTPILKAINTFVASLSGATQAFADFTTVLTGKKVEASTQNMANNLQGITDTASDMADGVAASVKKAKGSLAKFDELNVMSKDDSSSSSGTSADNEDGASASPLGGEVSVNPKIGQELDDLKRKFKKLSSLFAKGFDVGFKSQGFDAIKTSIYKIGQNLKEIFTSPGVANAVEEFIESTIYNLGRILGSAASIGASMGVLLVGGMDKFLEQSKDVIKDKIVSILDISAQSQEISGNFFEAVADIFTVFEGENAQQIVADLLSIFAESFLSLTELSGKSGRDIADAITKPIIKNKDKIKQSLENTLKPLSTIVGGIKTLVQGTFNSINKAYDTYLRPAFEVIGNGFATVFEGILDGYNEYLSPVLGYISERFSHLVSAYISPLIDSLANFFGSIAEAVAMAWEFMSPFVAWLIKEFFSKLSTGLMGIWTVIEFVLSSISVAITTISNVLTGLLDFIKGVFSGDWEKAWGGIKKIFTSLIDGIIAIFASFINLIKNKLTAIGVAIKNKFKIVLESVVLAFQTAWENIKKAFSFVGGFFKGVWDLIKKPFGSVGAWFENTFKKAWEGVKNVFSVGGKIFDGIKNGIADTFKSIVNTLVKGINKVVQFPFNKINDMLNGIRAVEIPLIGKPFEGLWDENPLPVPQIPMLAQGGYVKANTPQLAMIGDNKRYGEVVAPENKLQELLNQAVSAGNSNGDMSRVIELLERIIQALASITFSFTANVDGNALFDTIVSLNDMYKKQTGRSAI